MRKYAVLALIILLAARPCRSQDSMHVLHPVVGHIIDQNEKMYYLLFPEISNDRFKLGYIKPAGENYFLVARLLNDSILTTKLDTSDIRKYRTNIGKLYAYYSELMKNDSITESEKVTKMVEVKNGGAYPLHSPLLNTGIQETIGDESRRDSRLQDDAELKKLWKQGSNIDNAGLYIDFGYVKKKKK